MSCEPHASARDPRRIVAALLVWSLTFGPACRSGGGSYPRPHVVIITIDTTRADRLSAYGFAGTSQPNLDRLAAGGAIFHQAFTPVPLTLPSHASLFSGVFPPRHGVRDNVGAPLGGDVHTLAEIVRARGFRTAAFTGSLVLGPERGLAQGFDHYSAPIEHDAGGSARPALERRADAVIDDAVAWLDTAATSPVFLWTHLYDPHRPYDPPASYKMRHLDPYVGEIAFADAAIGRLLDALERRGDLQRTLIVVTSDHGESLGEHGERDHGIFVYDGVLRVPLIIHGPGVPRSSVTTAVRLVDVMPTVLDLLGFPVPSVDGVSLVPLLHGRRRAPWPDVYAESRYPLRFGWAPLRTIRDDRFKLIEAPRPELYDLERDPFEERNIHGEMPGVAAALSARLVRVREPAPSSSESAQPDAGLRERLAALGYVGSGVSQPSDGRQALPDPKDCIGVLTRLVDNHDASGASVPRDCGPRARPR